MGAMHQAIADIRHDWQREEIIALFELPFNDLLFMAQQVHRKHFNPNEVQTSTLLSIKTGACPEDCAYCPQSGHYDTELTKEQLLAIEEVVAKAKAAQDTGATRFCMGAAWRSPREKDFPVVLEMVKQVKSLGLETCVTLGMLDAAQADALRDAGLDYYNHNLDTSPEYYGSIITTRTYQDRMDTLKHVRDAGINVCAGGILGMGESRNDRAGLLQELANMPKHPESVPINMLVAVEGTPLENVEALEPFEFVRTIAVARIIMPESYVRLSAGREDMNEQMQAMCFFAGANSIFYGEKLLTTGNPEADKDKALFEKLGIRPERRDVSAESLNEDAAAVSHSKEKMGSAEQTPLFYDATQSRA
jgi:biotin synthase|tara:strand:+ start:6149 stop:7234 length:1086 start_codon:yes stop_codon:yes gene_type:complete